MSAAGSIETSALRLKARRLAAEFYRVLLEQCLFVARFLSYRL